MRHRAFSTAALIAFPGLAHADLTAVYVTPNTPFQMTVQIAANGDVRGTMPMGKMAMLTLGEQGYIIEQDAKGAVVSRIEDVATVVTEQVAKLDPKFREEMTAHATPMALVLKGEATINGRTGDAYYLRLQNGDLSPRPIIVISHDPALAPLGRALAKQFGMSIKLGGRMMPMAVFQPMMDALQKGAPILFTGAELQSVSEAPIPSSAFMLPAKPLALDQVRQRRMARQPNGGG